VYPSITGKWNYFLSFYYKYCHKSVLSIDFLFLLLHLQKKQGLLGMNNNKKREETNDKS
jgi:hypothetical protein